MPVSTADYVSISDLLARYCWAVDHADEESWLALWTQDAVFAGATPEPAVGHDGLRKVPAFAESVGQGKLRHHVGNLYCDYLDDEDTVRARHYNLVTDWRQGGVPFCMAHSTLILVRRGDCWLIMRSDVEMLSADGAS